MKVYIITGTDYDDYTIYHVFGNEEDAANKVLYLNSEMALENPYYETVSYYIYTEYEVE